MKPAYFLDGNYPYDLGQELRKIEVIGPFRIEKFVKRLHAISDKGGLVAVDTETDGCDPKSTSPSGVGTIVTVQFAYLEDDDLSDEELAQAFLDGDDPGIRRVWIDVRNPKMLRALKPWLERQDALKVMHGSSYDCHQFQNHGIDLGDSVYADTLQMSRSQYPERLSHSLDGGAGLVNVIFREPRLTTHQALCTGKTSAKTGKTLKSVELRAMSLMVDDEEMRPFQQVYSTLDVYDTLRLYYVLKLWMVDMEWSDHPMGFFAHYQEKTAKFLPIVRKMERTGICVDRRNVESLLALYIEVREELGVEAFRLAGCPLNLNSSQQKAWLLFGNGKRQFGKDTKKKKAPVVRGLGLPCQEQVEQDIDPWVKSRNKDGSWTSGYPSTDKAALAWVLERVPADSDEAALVRTIQERQGIEKLISATLEPLLRNLRRRHQSGVRCPVFPDQEEVWYIHGNFSVKARTGRMAASLPNLQQIPSRSKRGKAIRHAFGCEEGEAVLVSDYSQLELNILGWYIGSLFGDLDFLTALRTGDLHQATADRMGCTRAVAKTINFGIIYGMSAHKLAADMRISLAEAEAFLAKYFKLYPGVLKYVRWAVGYARKHGTSRTMMGRYRQLEDINEKYKSGRRRGEPTWRARADERRAGNSPIQGSAQDIVEAACIAMNADPELLSYGFKMRIIVHDEIVATCKAQFKEKALARMCWIMENTVSFPIEEYPELKGLAKFPVSGGYGLTWGEAKEGGDHGLFVCLRCEGTGKRPFGKCKACKGEGSVGAKTADNGFAEAA